MRRTDAEWMAHVRAARRGGPRRPRYAMVVRALRTATAALILKDLEGYDAQKIRQRMIKHAEAVLARVDAHEKRSKEIA